MWWVVRIVKFWPIVTNLIVLLALYMSILDISISKFTYPIFGHSLLIDICFLIMSYKMHFCFWHKLLIYNLIAIILIEWIDVNIFSFEYMIYIRTLLALSCYSILTSIILYFRYGWFKKSVKITT